MRASLLLPAMHSSATCEKWYDQNVLRKTRDSIMSLEEGRDTLTPLEEFETDELGVLGVERVKRINEVKRKQKTSIAIEQAFIKKCRKRHSRCYSSPRQRQG